MTFFGDTLELMNGVVALAPEIGVEIGADGLEVEVSKVDAGPIIARRVGNRAFISYVEKAHFFRAFGLLVEELECGEGDFDISEQPQFSLIGPMIDVSQGNAVLRVETAKELLRRLALMGMNMIMLYAEDSFVVPEQPYFGYMRARYTQDEIREIDDYAYMLGIEMIPCIQTLSHFREVLKWNAYADIRDDSETVLVGEEKTYEFIEQLIRAASAPVRTKRIHIGMDEAWHLGLGQYLIKNGYRSTFDMMTEHLKRVVEITDKYELSPMMWSDMFFRAAANGEYYDLDCIIPKNVIDEVPPNVQQVAWIYHERDRQFYVRWFQKHAEFGAMPLFAGGIWNFHVFSPNYGITFASTNAALSACKEVGVKEVIVTLWGDDGTECDLFANLLGLQLYAEHAYAPEVDEGKLERRFNFCTGGNARDFLNLQFIDETPGVSAGNYDLYNPSRYLMWQNPLLGLFDENIRSLPLNQHYQNLHHKFDLCASRNGAYAGVFEYYGKLCSVLELKSELGIKLTDAYRAGHRDTLIQIANVDIPEIERRVSAMRDFHRERWYRLYKALGWEVMDVRYGTLLMSLKLAAERVQEYLAGRVERIEELEEERLLFQGQEGLLQCYYYPLIPSASRIAWYES